ncbi:hypothetical protein K491DRAFT_757395 [Lophiostoma macrostomum CBS 122681]|uniref:SET domain-containing protein n=1 Tax=Lophiostoma macrostomum CBS 122681 TaxID=1314788 RepID=A0A6A6TCG1_9PLEO|nr:hypothetical protein K491DRAFT_757395 [Lophiostoma macrostomum CBS 122681]
MRVYSSHIVHVAERAVDLQRSLRFHGVYLMTCYQDLLTLNDTNGRFEEALKWAASLVEECKLCTGVQSSIFGRSTDMSTSDAAAADPAWTFKNKRESRVLVAARDLEPRTGGSWMQPILILKKPGPEKFVVPNYELEKINTFVETRNQLSSSDKALLDRLFSFPAELIETRVQRELNMSFEDLDERHPHVFQAACRWQLYNWDGLGVSIARNYFRHSCRPNVCVAFGPDLSFVAFHATRFIREGEELLVNYLDHSYEVREYRQKLLKEKWGFTWRSTTLCANSSMTGCRI